MNGFSPVYHRNIIPTLLRSIETEKGNLRAFQLIRLCISLNQTIQTYMVAQVDLQAACPRVPLVATNVLADEGLHA